MPLTVRLSLAALLMIAAGLKGLEFLTREAAGRLSDSGGVKLLVATELEFLFAVWLILGWSAVRLKCAAILLFSLFASVAIYQVIIGASTCGCFGFIQVHPLYTFFIDGAAVILLYFVRVDPKAALETT